MTKSSSQDSGIKLGVKDGIKLGSDDRIKLGVKDGIELGSDDGIKNDFKLSSDDGTKLGIKHGMELATLGWCQHPTVRQTMHSLMYGGWDKGVSAQTNQCI